MLKGNSSIVGIRDECHLLAGVGICVRIHITQVYALCIRVVLTYVSEWGHIPGMCQAMCSQCRCLVVSLLVVSLHG